jgi:hypothetical protein
VDQAIAIGQEAVDATPAGHPDRPGMLSNLGLALGARFERTGQQADVDQEITFFREAADATPVGHPERPGRLSGDIARLVPILYSPEQSQQAFPRWLGELTSLLQTLLVFQLPVQRLWLLAAVQDPPVSVPIAIWSMAKEPPVWLRRKEPPTEGKKILGILGMKTEMSEEEPYSVTPEGKRAAQIRATDELRGELLALGYPLEALAALVDAAIKCRSELKPVEGR